MSRPFPHLVFFARTIGASAGGGGLAKADEFTILPQVHEIVHFLQYNTLYQRRDGGEEEFLPMKQTSGVRDYITATSWATSSSPSPKRPFNGSFPAWPEDDGFARFWAHSM